MFNLVATPWFRALGGAPAFRVYGKSRAENHWRIVEVFATERRNLASRWPAPFFAGTCITWTAQVIAVGWDFAEQVLSEQKREPASWERPVEVLGGRIRAAVRSPASASEILAHECGHTWQARRLSWLYLPTGAMFTLFREGPRWWNRFENQASEQGQFGGIVNGSVHSRLHHVL